MWNLLVAYTIVASIFAFVLAALGVPLPHFLAVIPNFSKAVYSSVSQISGQTIPLPVFFRLVGLYLLNTFGIFVASLGGFLYDVAVALGAPPPLPSLMFLVGAILQGAFVVWKILSWIGWRPT